VRTEVATSGAKLLVTRGAKIDAGAGNWPPRVAIWKCL